MEQHNVFRRNVAFSCGTRDNRSRDGAHRPGPLISRGPRAVPSALLHSHAVRVSEKEAPPGVVREAPSPRMHAGRLTSAQHR